MRVTQLLMILSLCCGMNTIVMAHQDKLPDDYPSHNKAVDCTDPGDIADLQQKLHQYNITRVQVGSVLHSMADSYNLEDKVRKELLGYAELFDKMSRNMPPPDPDSDEFRNFDFKLGLTLTAVTVYLNTRDEPLTRRFHTDQQDPGSTLGRYLAELDHTRNDYMSRLNVINSAEKGGGC